jgi:hypothetical protein
MLLVRFALLLACLAFGSSVARATAPALTSPTTASGRVGYNFFYEIRATGGVTRYDATDLPPGVTVNNSNGVISGEPTRAGTYESWVWVSNADGTMSQKVTIDIQPPPTQPPVISVAATYESHYVLYNYPANVVFTATASNYPKTFTATGAPAAGYFGSSYTDSSVGAYRFDANNATPGIWHVTFNASNAAGSATAETTWLVRPSLMWRDVSKREYDIGEVISVHVGFNSNVDVTGTPRVGLGGQWRDSKPRYATYVSGSGTRELVFEYQTTLNDFLPNDGGLGPVDLNGGTIRHASGLDAVLTYPVQLIGTTLPMFHVYGPAVITSATTATGTVGAGFRYAIATNTGASKFMADGLPPGLSLDATNGVITGVPTLSGTFQVALSAWNPFRPTWGTATLALTILDSPTGRPTITQLPPSRAAAAGTSVTFTTGSTAPNPTYQWQWNGKVLADATQPSLTLSNVGPADAGLYTANVTDSGQTSVTPPAILGIASAAKVIGSGAEVGPDIVHQNGNVYDQVLLQGPAATVTADRGQVVRLSYVDLNDDIVQVEFSGSGTLSIVLDSASGPMTAQNYNQPGVSYMKGHAGIVISGADETTNVSVFSVGRITAVNQSLFRSDVTYDGVADIAFLAIHSANGRFGGARLANTSFWSTRGITGVYAPGVNFTGPVYLCDIIATEDATPTILLGQGFDVKITGGDLNQTNGRAVQVHGFARLVFADGATSHGDRLPALANRARLEDNAQDVTAAVVVNP